MDDALIQLVWNRAGQRCEYCHLAQVHSTLQFEIDHIIARKHGGQAIPSNLALLCFYCNSYKGPNIAGLDSGTGAITKLFHPADINGLAIPAGMARSWPAVPPSAGQRSSSSKSTTLKP